MALPTSALAEFVGKELITKGYQEGRDGFPGFVDGGNSLFDKTLEALSVKIPISTDGNSNPQTIPVKHWHSTEEVVEAIREFLEAQEVDEEQEKVDAYDRAMSIL